MVQLVPAWCHYKTLSSPQTGPGTELDLVRNHTSAVDYNKKITERKQKTSDLEKLI